MQNNFNKLKVLIVDDDIDYKIPELLFHLEELGVGKVSVAYTVMDGITELRRDSYDLIIQGMQLPINKDEDVDQMGGIEMLKLLARNGICVPVIMCSGIYEYTAMEMPNTIGYILYGRGFMHAQVESSLEKIEEVHKVEQQRRVSRI